VCELAGDVASAAQVKQVKVLGAFAVIEALKADWKVVVVDTSNPLAGEMHDLGDVERHLPGYLETMLEWFRVYKMPEGWARNEIAGEGDGTFKGREYVWPVLRCSVGQIYECWARARARLTRAGRAGSRTP
jgi:inorganic pyrophosphatase